MHGFTGTGQCQSRNQPQLETLAVEKIRQWPMVVAGRLKADQHRTLEPSQVIGQLLKIPATVRQSQAGSPFRDGRFDKNLVIVLGDVHRYQCHALGAYRCFRSWMEILLQKVGLAPQPSQEC